MVCLPKLFLHVCTSIILKFSYVKEKLLQTEVRLAIAIAPLYLSQLVTEIQNDRTMQLQVTSFESKLE